MDIQYRNTYRTWRKLLRGNEAEPIEKEPVMAYDHKHGMAKWTAIWMAAIFVICLMASLTHADCSNLSPELQKAYKQLKNEGFQVSCRKGI